MIERHFAYFDMETGACLGERCGLVPEPDVDARLLGEARQAALNDWATRVSCPGYGEIGLDVTHLGYPLGDFLWSRFDVVDRQLSWPTMHRFLVVGRETLSIEANHESGRPVRHTDRQWVIDITGTPLERFFHHIWGRFVRTGTGWMFEPSTLTPARERADIQALMSSTAPLLLGVTHGGDPLDSSRLEYRSEVRELVRR